MSEFDILRSAVAGMDAQRSALDLAAQNVAAAEASPEARAFERLVPRFAIAPERSAAGPDAYEPSDGDPDEAGGVDDDAEDGTSDAPVRYLGASAQRGVEPDAVTEMVAVLNAQRAYEANASVYDLGKRLAERTIDLGRLQ